MRLSSKLVLDSCSGVTLGSENKASYLAVQQVMSQMKPQKRLLTWAMSKKVKPVPSAEEKMVLPEASANILSRVLVTWIFPLMVTGYKRQLTANDLYKLPDEELVDVQDAKFHENFNRRVAAIRSQAGEKEPKFPKALLLLALWDTFKWEFMESMAWKIFSDLLSVLSPLLSRELIQAVESDPTPVGSAVGYAIGCSLFIFFRGLGQAHFFTGGQGVGIKMRSVLTKSVFDKSFKLSEDSRHEYPTSTITSIMGTDLSRIEMALTYVGNILTLPITLGISIALLIVYIGPISLVGVAVFLIIMFCVVYSTKFLLTFRKRASVFTDQRVSYVKELLNNIKMIKYYTWEESYIAKITKIRNNEMRELLKIQTSRAMAMAFTLTVPFISSLVAFLAMYGVEGMRSVANIFTALTFFNVLAQQVLIVPLALSSTADMVVGLERTRKLLLSEEADPKEDYKNLDYYKDDVESDTAITISEATFKWPSYEESRKSISSANPMEVIYEDEEKCDSTSSMNLHKFTGLNNVDLSIKKGEFVVVTGLIGSGKTSLLNAMARIMKLHSGSLDVNGSLLLCGYPWVQNTTVQDNIIFGKPMDEKRYDAVVAACALEDDFNILESGDMTEVGERGITLSGGQKARLNLARAVYADADIILLDDVLSAVDARVGKHIMQECFLGLLKDKTRILATHQLSLIGAADRVIFLDGDSSIAIGTMDELKATKPNFVSLMDYSNENDKIEKSEEIEEGEEKALELISREQSIRRVHSTKALVKAEELTENVGLQVYARYMTLGKGVLGPAAIPILVTFIVLAAFMQVFTNVWLSFWTSDKFNNLTNGIYIGMFVLFTALLIVFVAIQFASLAYISNKASQLLNLMSLERVMYAPMWYFDTTPMGRIINRFTKDTDVADNEITVQARLLLYSMALIIATLIMCVIYIPWFAIAIPPMAIAYWAMGDLYIASSKPVKNLEAILRSFVYNNFNESLTGMETIKIYGLSAVNRFMHNNSMAIDTMNEASYVQLATRNWIAIYVNIISTAVVFLVAIMSATNAFPISASTVGLLMSYVLQISGYLSFVIRSVTMVEGLMVSVQRLVEYSFDLVQEAPYYLPEHEPRPTWPEKGEIVFKNVSMRYRPELPIVLKDVSFTAAPSEKIGICGRTGAGKSTITSALYRLVEIEEGGIMSIDGVDISKLGLKAIRSSLSIIPQDPVLFKGTIRENLDPFNEKTDIELWDALRRSGVIDSLKIEYAKTQKDAYGSEMHKFHLDQMVEDGGANFSLGERQLIALARALVRNTKILILDEATSSVDYETDSKIQQTIATEFAHCTILCVAHRLKTIVKYDRIMVLDKGAIIEFDTPKNLFESHGVFREMCDKSGIVAEDF